MKRTFTKKLHKLSPYQPSTYIVFAFFPFFISFFYFLLSIIPTNRNCQLNESKIPRPFRYPYFPFFSLLSSSFSHRFPLLNACAFASRRPPLPPLPRPRIVITAAHILGENETQGKIGEPASQPAFGKSP